MKKYQHTGLMFIKAGLLIIISCAFFSSCKKKDDVVTPAHDVVYVQTNNFNTDMNAVIAYRDKGDGVLEQITGSPFLTKGAGLGNPMQILGPADSDYELRLSSDKKFLLTVNSGSNTIAVFTIKDDGSLEHVAGSPFASGGQTPVSIDVADNYVFVVNKSQNPLQATPLAPNYSTFTINTAGFLTPVTGGKFETTAGTSPAHALVSRDKKYLFGVDFLGFMLSPAVGTLRSFTIGSTGTLAPVTGSPYVVPVGAMPDNGALGLWQHPAGTPLYVGFPAQGKVGVYNINATTGALTFQTSVTAGKAACWIRTNSTGNRMYVLNSGDNVVQVFNTSNALTPVSMQSLQLKNSGPDYTAGANTFKTSEDFSHVFSTDEKILYVVSQHTNTSFSIGNFNFIHTLKVADDGTLTEASEPLQLPVANNIRPKGSLVISR